jgi:hypothetical protein
MSDAEIGTLKENPNICFACSSFLDVPDDIDCLPENEEQEHIVHRAEKSETKSFHG